MRKFCRDLNEKLGLRRLVRPRMGSRATVVSQEN